MVCMWSSSLLFGQLWIVGVVERVPDDVDVEMMFSSCKALVELLAFSLGGVARRIVEVALVVVMEVEVVESVDMVPAEVVAMVILVAVHQI